LEMSPLKPFVGRHAARFVQWCAVRARWSNTIPLADVLDDARGRIAARTSSGGSNWWRSATIRASTSTRAPAASPRRIADTVPYMRLLSPNGSPGRPGPYVIETGVIGDVNNARASSQNLREPCRRCLPHLSSSAGIAPAAAYRTLAQTLAKQARPPAARGMPRQGNNEYQRHPGEVNATQQAVTSQVHAYCSAPHPLRLLLRHPDLATTSFREGRPATTTRYGDEGHTHTPTLEEVAKATHTHTHTHTHARK
jgi:hypothetical protein